jgi:hypothetical protein
MIATGLTSGKDWVFTHHLRQRATERGITEAAITAVLNNPQVTYTQNLYGPERQVRQRGELAVVVNRATRTVITVLFHDDAHWAGHHSTAAVVA